MITTRPAPRRKNPSSPNPNDRVVITTFANVLEFKWRLHEIERLRDEAKVDAESRRRLVGLAEIARALVLKDDDDDKAWGKLYDQLVGVVDALTPEDFRLPTA
jgi:hypothetical protein